MTDSPTLTDPSASFLMVLPPGWVRLPARREERPELARMVRQIIDTALPDDLPYDSVEPMRQELRKRLTGQVVEAGEAGANAVYLPVVPVDGFTPAASILETEVDDESEQEPADVIAGMIAGALVSEAGTGEDAEEEVTVAEVDGGIAARSERTIRRVQVDEELPEVDDRQLVYSIPVPHRAGRWTLMSFSFVAAPGGDGRLADALVALFDAMMTTFRWTDVPDTEPTTLERRLNEIAEQRAHGQ